MGFRLEIYQEHRYANEYAGNRDKLETHNVTSGSCSTNRDRIENAYLYHCDSFFFFFDLMDEYLR